MEHPLNNMPQQELIKNSSNIDQIPQNIIPNPLIDQTQFNMRKPDENIQFQHTGYQFQHQNNNIMNQFPQVNRPGQMPQHMLQQNLPQHMQQYMVPQHIQQQNNPQQFQNNP